MNLSHIMLDIETLGTGRDAAVVSIGACLFDPVAGRWPREGDDVPEADATFHQRIDLSREPAATVGKIDPSTVEWWLRQSAEAREALVAEGRVTLMEALGRLDGWLSVNFPTAPGKCSLSDYGTEARLWSNGPTFDVDILMDAYERCHLPFPVHFKAYRCCRTITDLAIEAGWDPRSITKNKLEHDALADALFQAEGVCAMYRHLGLSREPARS